MTLAPVIQIGIDIAVAACVSIPRIYRYFGALLPVTLAIFALVLIPDAPILSVLVAATAALSVYLVAHEWKDLKKIEREWSEEKLSKAVSDAAEARKKISLLDVMWAASGSPVVCLMIFLLVFGFSEYPRGLAIALVIHAVFAMISVHLVPLVDPDEKNDVADGPSVETGAP